MEIINRILARLGILKPHEPEPETPTHEHEWIYTDTAYTPILRFCSCGLAMVYISGFGWMNYDPSCKNCHGAGYLADLSGDTTYTVKKVPCFSCDGQGKIEIVFEGEW